MTYALLAISLTAVALVSASAAAVRANGRAGLKRWAERRLGGAPESPDFIAEHRRHLRAAGAAGAAALVTGGAGLAQSFVSYGAAATLLLALLFLIALIIFGQVIPRAAAIKWPEGAARMLPALRGVTALLAPVIEDSRTDAARAGDPTTTAPAARPEELSELLREGLLDGIGEDEEAEIIADVAQLGATTAADIMTDAADIFAMDETLPGHFIARMIADAGYSRVPLYRDSPDHFTGVVHAFDVLRLGNRVVEARRPLLSVLPDTTCTDLLRRMLREPAHMLLVADNNGRTLGLVTLEDVLEEVVGDIDDEHDEPGREALAIGAGHHGR
jgi:putative hemolysin